MSRPRRCRNWSPASPRRCAISRPRVGAHEARPATTLPPPTNDRTLVERFRIAVAAVPDRVVVNDGSRGLAYRELDDWSDALAGMIARRVPMDPHYPSPRLAYMAADSSVALLVMDTDAGAIAGDLALPALDVTDVRPVGATPAGPSPDSVAYTIYTSGSTGEPKGVLVSHANVSSLIAATEAVFDFSPDDACTLFHSTSFDFSVREIWAARRDDGGDDLLRHRAHHPRW